MLHSCLKETTSLTLNRLTSLVTDPVMIHVAGTISRNEFPLTQITMGGALKRQIITFCYVTQTIISNLWMISLQQNLNHVVYLSYKEVWSYQETFKRVILNILAEPGCLSLRDLSRHVHRGCLLTTRAAPLLEKIRFKINLKSHQNKIN